jgi:di/tricarboxylate transporter
MSDVPTGRPLPREDRHTPAQWYCLVAGIALLLGGIFGFISDASFHTGDGVQGHLFLGLEVNAIHNLVHAISGLILVVVSPRRESARVFAIAFGLLYGVVGIVGLADGQDVIGLMPVNAADNVLHLALAALGIATGLVSSDADGAAVDADRGTRFEHDAAATRNERAGG